MLKNLNGDYPDMHILTLVLFMLEIDIQQGDLSRRQIVYQLAGLSLREFLAFECGLKVPACSLEELLQNHVTIASNILLSSIFLFLLFALAHISASIKI